MKKILTAILCGLLFIALSTSAAKQPPPPPDNALTTSEFSTDLKLQQQKLEFFKDRLDSQDKRIGDLTFYLSLSLACFGVLMTVIVVFFSLRSTKEAVLSAKEEARGEVKEQAKTIIENWLGQEGQKLLAQKVEETLRPEVDKALGNIRKEAGGVLGGLEDAKRIAQDNNAKQKLLNEQQEEAISELTNLTVDKAKPLSDEQKKTVDEAAKELESKPPKEYRFEDWFMLGMQAFEAAKYETAADQFSKAAEATTESLNHANALLNKGVSLGQMQRNEAAVTVYDEVVRRYGDAAETVLRELVASALVNKGIRLGQMQRNEEEISAYDEVVRRYGEAAETALCEQVANALVNKGITLGQMQRNEEAIAAYDEVVRRYGDAAETALRVPVATALLNKGVSLGQMLQSEAAITAFDEVVRRYGEASETALRVQVANALVNKGISLGQMQRYEEAIAVFDVVVRSYGDAAESALRERVATALANKGVTLGKLDRNEDEIAACEEVVRRYGEAGETALRQPVSMARNAIGFDLLCKAKKSWKDGDETFATELLTQALSKIEAALKDRPDEPIYLGNQGYIFFLLGRRDEAQPILARAFSLGGEELRQAELKDADIHTLPQDEAFKELILGL